MCEPILAAHISSSPTSWLEILGRRLNLGERCWADEEWESRGLQAKAMGNYITLVRVPAHDNLIENGCVTTVRWSLILSTFCSVSPELEVPFLKHEQHYNPNIFSEHKMIWGEGSRKQAVKPWWECGLQNRISSKANFLPLSLSRSLSVSSISPSLVASGLALNQATVDVKASRREKERWRAV